MVKQAILLAGGKGTRLAARLNGLPKPLIDIAGKPLLERQIELLKLAGIDEVVLLVNFQAEVIRKFCEVHHNWDLKITLVDDGVPLGTAGATLAAWEYLADDFLVIYGDTMLEVDLARITKLHEAHPEVAATLFLHPNDHPHDSDLVELNYNGEIIAFHPYPHSPEVFLPNLVNAGLYVVRKNALASWQATWRTKLQTLQQTSPQLMDFGKDLFPALLTEGRQLLGYISPEYIKDCGTPARLDKVTKDFIGGRISAFSLEHPQRAVFLDRDGVLVHEINHLHHPDQLSLLPEVGVALKRLNESLYRAIVITNQPVVARGDCTLAELQGIHNKLETLLGREGAYLDRILYCPHHPERGFAGEVTALKIPCQCRKPAIGMIEKAQADWNIDLEHSWFVGDTTVDVQTAHNAGVRSILLETGHGGLDARYPIVADYTLPNLAVAVEFILKTHPQLLKQCREWVLPVMPGEVIVIGGLSRSGKSILASTLKEALRERGITTHILALDGWLKPKDEREPGVLGRYDVQAINALFMACVNRHEPMTLAVPIYDKKARAAQVIKQSVTIGTQDVIIIEGVVGAALAPAVQDAGVHTWFVEIDESVRKERVLREYSLRAKSLDEAVSIYEKRLLDENPIVLESRKNAQLTFDLRQGLG
jgi:histidinol-phosphate phosphatase family protein